MYLIKNKGIFIPVDEDDEEHFNSIPEGGVIKCSDPRNWEFHKKAMKLLKTGFRNQEKYSKFEIYRKVITVRAGYFDEIEIIEGEVIPQAKSISYNEMDSGTFRRFYKDVLDVIASDLNIAGNENALNEIESFYES